MTPDTLENERLLLQARLDAMTSREDRGHLGQFSTPSDLAPQMVQEALRLMDSREPIHLIDPAFGTGVFLSALLQTLDGNQPVVATGFEVDLNRGSAAAELWSDMTLDLRIEDFTAAGPPTWEDERGNLLLCNPPYLRNQLIPAAEKRRLRRLAGEITGISVSPLAGLHAYFLLLSHAWLATDGLAAWLVPGQLLEVTHGLAVREYLTEKVTLMRLHRFEPGDLQFEGASVSSSVAWFRNRPPSPDHIVDMTVGGHHPRSLRVFPTRSRRPCGRWEVAQVSAIRPTGHERRPHPRRPVRHQAGDRHWGQPLLHPPQGAGRGTRIAT